MPQLVSAFSSGALAGGMAAGRDLQERREQERMLASRHIQAVVQELMRQNGRMAQEQLGFQNDLALEQARTQNDVQQTEREAQLRQQQEQFKQELEHQLEQAPKEQRRAMVQQMFSGTPAALQNPESLELAEIFIEEGPKAAAEHKAKLRAQQDLSAHRDETRQRMADQLLETQRHNRAMEQNQQARFNAPKASSAEAKSDAAKAVDDIDNLLMYGAPAAITDILNRLNGGTDENGKPLYNDTMMKNATAIARRISELAADPAATYAQLKSLQSNLANAPYSAAAPVMQRVQQIERGAVQAYAQLREGVNQKLREVPPGTTTGQLRDIYETAMGEAVIALAAKLGVTPEEFLAMATNGIGAATGGGAGGAGGGP